MLCLWNAGIQDELFYLVYKLNEHAKIKVFTPFGETRMFEVDDIVKQGTTLDLFYAVFQQESIVKQRHFLLEIQKLAHLDM